MEYLGTITFVVGHYYVAGLSESLVSSCIQCNCPCADPSNAVVPFFLGDNHYCESGNLTNIYINLLIICTPLTLSGIVSSVKVRVLAMEKSPPWFSVELSVPTTTTDNIDVHNKIM